MTSWEISNSCGDFFLIKSLLAVAACQAGWGGMGSKEGPLGRGKTELLARREGQGPQSLVARSVLPSRKHPYFLFSALVLGDQILEPTGLIEGIKHSIWRSCLSQAFPILQ